MRKPFAVLAMVKNEGIFMPFWLSHYRRFFTPDELFVHSDGSIDDTEALCAQAGVNFVAVEPGTIAVGQNDKYVKSVIEQLLQTHDCVLFAESPDDIIIPGANYGHNLRSYLREFLKHEDRYRFLTGINITQRNDEPPWDGQGRLLANRSTAIRCPQYDNAFLWREVPTWGRGWHDLGGKRLEGMGDEQGEKQRLYNLHIHYADFGLANKRHHVRQATFTEQQRAAYRSEVDEDLRQIMDEMTSEPARWFSNGKLIDVEPWMKLVI